VRAARGRRWRCWHFTHLSCCLSHRRHRRTKYVCCPGGSAREICIIPQHCCIIEDDTSPVCLQHIVGCTARACMLRALSLSSPYVPYSLRARCSRRARTTPGSQQPISTWDCNQIAVFSAGDDKVMEKWSIALAAAPAAMQCAHEREGKICASFIAVGGNF
jgi:hypothetical protein